MVVSGGGKRPGHSARSPARHLHLPTYASGLFLRVLLLGAQLARECGGLCYVVCKPSYARARPDEGRVQLLLLDSN